jgi:hypothetical protein
VSVLAAATAVPFHDLFLVLRARGEVFHGVLRRFGPTYAALMRGDVYCATQLVAAALQRGQASKSSATEATTSAACGVFHPGMLESVTERQRFHLHTCRGEGLSPGLFTAAFPRAVETHAEALQSLPAMSFCGQVAGHCYTNATCNVTVDDSPCNCRLSDRSFLKQQCAVEQTDARRRAPRRLNSDGLPDVCVLCSLLSQLPTRPGVISLCTPAKLQWLPAAMLERARETQQKQSVAWSIPLPLVHLREWQRQEAPKWLSRKLRGVSCTFMIDDTAQQLFLVCAQQHVEVTCTTLEGKFNTLVSGTGRVAAKLP